MFFNFNFFNIVSDTCFKNKENDKSGPLLKQLVSDTSLDTGKLLKGKILCTDIVPDDEIVIKVRVYNFNYILNFLKKIIKFLTKNFLTENIN